MKSETKNSKYTLFATLENNFYSVVKLMINPNHFVGKNLGINSGIVVTENSSPNSIAVRNLCKAIKRLIIDI